MTGSRWPLRVAAAKLARALRTHPGHSAAVAAPDSTSRASAVPSPADASWSILTAPGCAPQSEAAQAMSGVPVVYPAAWPVLGACGRFDRVASQPVTVVICAFRLLSLPRAA